MVDLRFEWDPKRASANEKKHGVTFDEAKTVFQDADALVIPDPDHSAAEDRFIILGLSAVDRALVAVHCFRSEGLAVRIISARMAGTKEQKPYWERKV